MTADAIQQGMRLTMGESVRDLVRRLATGEEPEILRGDDVFIRTFHGRLEVQRRDSSLPRRLRTLLLLVDGRRSVDQFRAMLSHYRSMEEGFDMLRRMGYIEKLPPPWDI